PITRTSVARTAVVSLDGLQLQLTAVARRASFGQAVEQADAVFQSLDPAGGSRALAAPTLPVTLGDGRLAISRTLEHGEYILVITNNGTMTHALQIAPHGSPNGIAGPTVA